ncbi:metallophosphoesterase family protein [Planktotalea arctica]|uniref:metallophosphoesterase family protein n=1 Tax=Planktotalea arctica TaxID=1481893 RepID=UPI001593A8BF|nr:metallophosphoesterase [Planktotalea arctica]
MRFLHTADLHLAKPFGRFDEDTRAALRVARLDALGKIGETARAHGAGLILVAGDTFDAEAPPSKIVRRALDIIGSFDDLTWVLLPGNHDSLAAVDLWERIERDKPNNLLLAMTPEVMELNAHVAILPAPPSVRDPGVDLTDWMGAATSGAHIRIGLAHGGIMDFGSEEGTVAVIRPDRAEVSELDYLALGDWHGQKSITARTWYAGAPEADSFKAHAPASALLVEINARGAGAQVTPVPIGRFTWCALALEFFAGIDPVQQLVDALPPAKRDKTLVRIEASGRLGLLEQSRLRVACSRLADDFHSFEINLDKLGIEQAADDLDLIAAGGALRAAADSLFEASDLQGRTPEEAQIAQIALTHLFHLAQEEPPR